MTTVFHSYRVLIDIFPMFDRKCNFSCHIEKYTSTCTVYNDSVLYYDNSTKITAPCFTLLATLLVLLEVAVLVKFSVRSGHNLGALLVFAPLPATEINNKLR